MDTTLMMTRTGIHLPYALRFVESEDRYSVYLDPDGEEVYLAHGTAKVLVDFDTIDIAKRWAEFVAFHGNSWNAYCQRETFIDTLRTSVIDDEQVDEYMFCTDCYTVEHQDEISSTGNGNQVCESCSSEYYYCNDCEESWPSTTTTLEDTEVCERCRSNYWSFCDDCDGYWRDANGHEDHDDDDDDDDDDDRCGCESPDQNFTVRNDGDAPLNNDTRVTITLPAGVISAEGINTIARHLQSCAYALDYEDTNQQKLRDLSYRLSELGERWQTKDGNYTKRLSRFAYKQFALKVTPEIISTIGNIARDHSTAVDFEIETTRDLNQSASMFVHGGSCWWTSYSYSRCTLKSNGGFGLRTFATNDDTYPQGRAWVIPMRRADDGTLTPTFETQEPDAFIVFNGYGTLQGYAAARIMSHMAGMTYRKVSFSGGERMYVNSDSGYLIAPEEIAEHYTDGSLHLSLSQHSDLFHNESKVLTNA